MNLELSSTVMVTCLLDYYVNLFTAGAIQRSTLSCYGPEEFHTFSKWNQRQTLCCYSGSPKKDCKTGPISLHKHDTLNAIIKKDGPTSAHCKIFPQALIVIIPSPLFADNPLTCIHELALETIWINLAFKGLKNLGLTFYGDITRSDFQGSIYGNKQMKLLSLFTTFLGYPHAPPSSATPGSQFGVQTSKTMKETMQISLPQSLVHLIICSGQHHYQHYQHYQPRTF
jgi:hypothetical protein